MTELFESKPRWPGAPKICLKTNLPAFETEKELKKYLTDFSPSVKVERTCKCKVCNHWHAKT